MTPNRETTALSATRDQQSPQVSLTPGQWTQLALAILLLLGFSLATGLMPTGPFEFCYAPFEPGDLPFSPLRGFTVEQLFAHLARLLLLAPALIMLSLIIGHLSRIQAPSPATLQRIALYTCIASILLVTVAMFGVLGTGAVVDDELTYRQQAMLLAEGRLGDKSLPVPLVGQPFVIRSLAGYTGKYLFGEPVVQIPGVLLGVPALAHIPLTALALFCFYRLVRLSADRELAAIAVSLLALSPMLIFTAATGQTQITSLTCICLAGLGCAMIRTGTAVRGALLCALGLGFGVTVRVQAVVPVGLVIGLFALVSLIRQRRWAGLLALIGGCCAFIALIAAYNKALSGSYFKLPWFLANPVENYGFGEVWPGRGYRHTLRRAFENLAVAAVRFNGWWLGWPAGLLALWYWHRVGRPRQGATMWLWAGLAVLIFEFGYYSTGVSDTGPIYHFELLLPGALLLANAIRNGLRTRPALVVSAVVVHVVVGTGSFLYSEGSRLHRLALYNHADANRTLEVVKRPALLLYETRCSEQLSHGWLFNGFPRRQWSDRDDVVTLAKPPARFLPRYLQRYAKRHCYYYRRNPEDARAELHRCDSPSGRRLLSRPPLTRREGCLWIKPTAVKAGWLKSM